MPATDDPTSWRPPNEQAMFRTINALLMHQLKLKMHDGDDATNTNDDDDDDDSELSSGMRRAPDSLDFNRKRKFTSVKFQLPEKDETALNEIIEECEYDSDIGKFKCKDDDAMDESENSSTSSMVDHYLQVEQMNDLNSPLKCINRNGLDMNNFDNMNDEVVGEDDDLHYKIVMKRIEFFESNGTNGKVDNRRLDEVDAQEMTKNVQETTRNLPEPTNEDKLLSTILFAIFILTVALLIIFPLPN